MDAAEPVVRFRTGCFFISTNGQKKKQKRPSGVVRCVLQGRERRSWEPVPVGSEHQCILTLHSTMALIDDVQKQQHWWDGYKQQTLSSREDMKPHNGKKLQTKKYVNSCLQHLCSRLPRAPPQDNARYASSKTKKKTFFCHPKMEFF